MWTNLSKSMSHCLVAKSQIQRKPLRIQRNTRRSVWLLQDSSQRNSVKREIKMCSSSFSILSFLVIELWKTWAQASALPVVKQNFQASQLNAMSHIRIYAPVRDICYSFYKRAVKSLNIYLFLLVSMTKTSVCTTSGKYLAALFCSCAEGFGTASTFVGS